MKSSHRKTRTLSKITAEHVGVPMAKANSKTPNQEISEINLFGSLASDLQRQESPVLAILRKYPDIAISTLAELPGAKIEKHFGMVTGNATRSRNAVLDVWSGVKSMVGGELKVFTKLHMQEQYQALERMVREARAIGANAIVGVRIIPGASAGEGTGAGFTLAGTALKVSNVHELRPSAEALKDPGAQR